MLLVSFRLAADGLDDSYGQMYNLQFEQAHRTLADWQERYPADPLGPVSDAAAYLYSEFERLNILQSEFFSNDARFTGSGRKSADPAVKRSFDQVLEKGRGLTDGILARDPLNPGALFAAVLEHGLRADYAALVEKRFVAALSETKQGRLYAERLLAVKPDYYDAYLAIGVENYLLSLKAAPVRWFLRLAGAQTDRQMGLEKLRLTAEKGRFLLPFAKMLLAVAALRDKDRPRAREQLDWLVIAFPLNRLYKEELAKLR